VSTRHITIVNCAHITTLNWSHITTVNRLTAVILVCRHESGQPDGLASFFSMCFPSEAARDVARLRLARSCAAYRLVAAQLSSMPVTMLSVTAASTSLQAARECLACATVLMC
jgi:hypothetical protein